MPLEVSPEEPITHVHTCEDCQETYTHPRDQPANCKICPLCVKARRYQEGKFENTGY